MVNDQVCMSFTIELWRLEGPEGGTRRRPLGRKLKTSLLSMNLFLILGFFI